MTRTVKLFTGHLRCWQAAAIVLRDLLSSACSCLMSEAETVQIDTLIREPKLESKKEWKKNWCWYICGVCVLVILLYKVILVIWKTVFSPSAWSPGMGKQLEELSLYWLVTILNMLHFCLIFLYWNSRCLRKLQLLIDLLKMFKKSKKVVCDWLST